MSIVTAVIGTLGGIDPKYGIDPLLLTSEERASAHFVAQTAAGRTVRVSLPRGTELQDGDVLTLEGDWAVVVKAAEEDLLFVRPGADAVAWWAACYQLGNLHRPVRFLAEGILTPSDPMAIQNMADLGVPFEKVRRPFIGRRFGAAHGLDHHGHGDGGATAHAHSHDHDGHHHDHPHDHDHGDGHDHHHHGHDGRHGHTHKMS
jgi:urease accessory protein